MKKNKKSWLYASTALILALGAGTVATTVAGPQSAVSADSVTQDSAAVSNAGSAVDSAAGSLTSAASSAIGQGIEVTSGMEIVSPSYAAPSSATSSAVSNANSANVSSYSSAASSAASYMSSQATSLSSVTSSYSSAVGSYNAAANSATQSSLVWSDAGVAVYGSYNSAYADTTGNGATGTPNGSTSYYDYTVVASEASLVALLGSEYISGAITATQNISDVTGATYSPNDFVLGGVTYPGGYITFPDSVGEVTFTMNGVGKTNTGKVVNALYTIDYSGQTTGGFWLNSWGMFGNANTSGASYLKVTISLVDSDGNPVNGIFLGEVSDVDDALGAAGVYGLNNLTLLNPNDSGLTTQNSTLGGVYVENLNANAENSSDSASTPLDTFGFSGWGHTFSFVSNYRAYVVSEDGSGSTTVSPTSMRGQKVEFMNYHYAIEPTAPTASITYVSVDKPVLYELVTPPVDNPVPPKTPSTPKAPVGPQTPMMETPASPKMMPLATSRPVVRPTVSMLPSTGDTAGSGSLMYGGFAVLGALTFAGVMSRKRHRLLEESKKAADAASKR